jgi:hypothetical protein
LHLFSNLLKIRYSTDIEYEKQALNLTSRIFLSIFALPYSQIKAWVYRILNCFIYKYIIIKYFQYRWSHSMAKIRSIHLKPRRLKWIPATHTVIMRMALMSTLLFNHWLWSDTHFCIWCSADNSLKFICHAMHSNE